MACESSEFTPDCGGGRSRARVLADQKLHDPAHLGCRFCDCELAAVSPLCTAPAGGHESARAPAGIFHTHHVSRAGADCLRLCDLGATESSLVDRNIDRG